MTNDVYEILNLEQGTEAWIQERLKYVTASQTPALLGLSPYQKPFQLLEEKLTRKEAEVESYTQYIFQKGHDAEYSARLWAESDLGIKLPPAVILSKRCDGLLASLDGFNTEKKLIMEAKYMGAKSLEEVKSGKLKPHHECQVQAQLLASGADKCIFFATTTNGDSAIMEIKPSGEYAKKITDAIQLFLADIREIEVMKQNLLNKYKMNAVAPLKTLASGAKDPFRVRTR